MLAADLVVGTSGQGSRAPHWLEVLGYEVPEEEVVDAKLGYATRWFRVPENFSGDWEGLAILPDWPDNPPGGTLRRVEGSLWTVVLIGLRGNHPLTDGEGFLKFARALPSSIIYDAIRPLSRSRRSTATAARPTAAASTKGPVSPRASSSSATPPAP